MSDDAQAPVPAGWYPESSTGRSRWWDGSAWTEQYADGAPGAQKPVGSTSNPAIWGIVALPVLSILSFLSFDFEGYLRSALDQAGSPTASLTDSGYLLLQGASLVFYALTVLLAFLDRKALLKAGVSRPFHWAWAFLGGVVYIIGRSVIVYRRTRGGLAPLWTYAAIYVISIVIAGVKVSQGFSVIAEYMGTASN